MEYFKRNKTRLLPQPMKFTGTNHYKIRIYHKGECILSEKFTGTKTQVIQIAKELFIPEYINDLADCWIITDELNVLESAGTI